VWTEAALVGVALIAIGRAGSSGMISDLHSSWLISRKISIETALHMGLYSAKRGSDGSVQQNDDGDVLVFPYVHQDKVVGAKYRGPKKLFWQMANARKQFWNLDILKDSLLTTGKYPLLIVEGEMDALAVMEAGYPFVVSVPDGAPPARDAEGRLIHVPENADDIIPEDDTKFSYLQADWDDIAKIPKIVIGTDSDEAGQRLAAELVRRLDRIRCSFTTMPTGIKDWNELLIEQGTDAIQQVIRAAKPYPVEGVYRFSDLPPEQPIRTVSTGWNNVDEFLKPYLGAFMVVGGFPGHGKSTWTMQLVANLAAMHGWSVAVASFEMQVVPYVTNSIMTGYLQTNIKRVSPQRRADAEAFLEKRFVFIAPNRADMNTEHDIDWLIDRMETAVIRDGVRVVLIDPFNEIEHRKRPDESMTEYIGRAIRKLKSFAMRFEVLVCVVVHPTKGSAGIDSADLSLYSLADSSHWANKADIGVIVGRMGNMETDSLTGIYIKKIRYQPDAGAIGQAVLNFDKENRLFL
jgi:twinkle protein